MNEPQNRQHTWMNWGVRGGTGALPSPESMVLTLAKQGITWGASYSTDCQGLAFTGSDSGSLMCPLPICISNKLFADADAAGPGTTGWELLPDLIGLELELRHVFKRSPGAQPEFTTTHVEMALYNSKLLWFGEKIGWWGAQIIQIFMVYIDQIYKISVQLL